MFKDGTSEAGIHGIWSQTIFMLSPILYYQILDRQNEYSTSSASTRCLSKRIFKIYPAFTGFLDAPDGQTKHNIK